MQWKQI